MQTLFFLILTYILIVNGQFLQVNVVNDDPNSFVVIPGIINQFIIIQYPISKVDITCTKNGFTFGTIFTLVNKNQVLSPFSCNSYSNGIPSICLSQQFVYDLNQLGNSTNFYAFDCGITEDSTINAPTLIMQRLCKFEIFFFLFLYIHK